MAYFYCLPNGVFNRWCYDSQKHIFEMKGKTMYLHCKMVYNKI